jgi:hypothetical protein
MPFLKNLLPEKENLRQIVRSGLLLATSAALGGIAVAIWNRRTLADIRRPSDEPEASSEPET